jgi:hypothetical protein
MMREKSSYSFLRPLVKGQDHSFFKDLTGVFCTVGGTLVTFDMGRTASATGRQGMLTSPWHLIPPLIYSEVRVLPFSDLYFL